MEKVLLGSKSGNQRDYCSEIIVIVQVRDGDVLDKGSWNENGEIGVELRYILQVELIGFVDKLDVMGEDKR